MNTADHTKSVNHLLVWYSKEDDSLVGECPLRGLDWEQLKGTFRPPEQDPLMYDSYPVGRTASEFLGKALGISLDLERFDYFVECDLVTKATFNTPSD